MLCVVQSAKMDKHIISMSEKAIIHILGKLPNVTIIVLQKWKNYMVKGVIERWWKIVMKGYAGEVSVGAHVWITVHCHNYQTTAQRSGMRDHKNRHTRCTLYSN